MSNQLDFIAPLNCSKCKRLNDFLELQGKKFPYWFNNPVPSFGDIDSKVLILGLAPGLKGANATGRPFTGDFAGEVLFSSLSKFGLAENKYKSHINDGLKLKSVRITNSVKCVPPKNLPTSEEVHNCRIFLAEEIKKMKNLKIVLVLGGIAHKTFIKFFQLKISSYPFIHGKIFKLPNGIELICSYHCSKYNIYTKRLTTEMFDNIIKNIKLRI